MWVILALLGVILAIAVVLVVIGIRNPYSENDMRLFERLGDFSKSGEQVDLEKLELSLPFTERVIYPLARKLGEITLRFTPQNWISRINRRLELAQQLFFLQYLPKPADIKPAHHHILVWIHHHI